MQEKVLIINVPAEKIQKLNDIPKGGYHPKPKKNPKTVLSTLMFKIFKVSYLFITWISAMNINTDTWTESVRTIGVSFLLVFGAAIYIFFKDIK